MEYKEMILADIRHSKTKLKPSEWHYIDIRVDVRIYYTFADNLIYFIIIEHLYLSDVGCQLYHDKPHFPYLWDTRNSFVAKQGEGVIEKDGIRYMTITQAQPDILDTMLILLMIRRLEINFKEDEK
jgi:hypothetical protein